jgi:hypothetical protein
MNETASMSIICSTDYGDEFDFEQRHEVSISKLQMIVLMLKHVQLMNMKELRDKLMLLIVYWKYVLVARDSAIFGIPRGWSFFAIMCGV